MTATTKEAREKAGEIIAEMLKTAEAASPGWLITSISVKHLSESRGGPKLASASIQTKRVDSTAPPYGDDWERLNARLCDLLDELERETGRQVLDGKFKPQRSDGPVVGFKIPMGLTA